MKYICTSCSQVFNDTEKETEYINDCPKCSKKENER